jgi:hypothetical protein
LPGFVGCVQNAPQPTYDQAAAKLANEINVLDHLNASRQAELDRWEETSSTFRHGSTKLSAIATRQKRAGLDSQKTKEIHDEMVEIIRVEDPKHKQMIADLDFQIAKQKAAVEAAKIRRDSLAR